MITPCPICGKEDCREYLGQGVIGFFHTEQDVIKYKGGTVLRLTEAVYVNSDYSKVLPAGDPDVRFLLGAKGALVTEADAKRLGVTATEPVDNMPPHGQLLRAPLAVVPAAVDDDSRYYDQTKEGKAARAAARESNGVVVEVKPDKK